MWQGFAGSGQPAAGMFELGGDGPIELAGAVAGTVGARRRARTWRDAPRSSFLLGWHFPNRRSWRGGHGPARRGRAGDGRQLLRHDCADAWDVLAAQAPRLAELEE